MAEIKKEIFNDVELKRYIVTYTLEYRKRFTRIGCMYPCPFDEATYWSSETNAQNFAEWVRSEMQERDWDLRTIQSVQIEPLSIREFTTKIFTLED